MSTLVVTGRIGSDAETKTLQSGKPVVSWSVADQQGYGENKHTIWIKCAMFGERAAKVAPYLTKGTIVECSGTPTVEAWNDKAKGEARAALKLTVQEVKLHGGGQRDSSEPAPKRGAAQREEFGPYEDKIPF